MIDFCRKIDRPLVVRWADVAVVTQFVCIDVFEECAAKCFDMKYRVEVNRRTGKLEWTVEQLVASMESVVAADSVRSVLGDVRSYISVELGDAIDAILIKQE